MIIVAAAILVLAALLFTLFVRPQDVPEPVPVSPVQHLEDRKQAIYENLRDLQFEYRLGKLSDEDYQQTKQALQRELAGVLADTEEALKKLGLPSSHVTAAKPVAANPARPMCSQCGATFSRPLRFCGECGKPMHEEVRI